MKRGSRDKKEKSAHETTNYKTHNERILKKKDFRGDSESDHCPAYRGDLWKRKLDKLRE